MKNILKIFRNKIGITVLSCLLFFMFISCTNLFNDKIEIKQDSNTYLMLTDNAISLDRGAYKIIPTEEYALENFTYISLYAKKTKDADGNTVNVSEQTLASTVNSLKDLYNKQFLLSNGAGEYTIRLKGKVDGIWFYQKKENVLIEESKTNTISFSLEPVKSDRALDTPFEEYGGLSFTMHFDMTNVSSIYVTLTHLKSNTIIDGRYINNTTSPKLAATTTYRRLAESSSATEGKIPTGTYSLKFDFLSWDSSAQKDILIDSFPYTVEVVKGQNSYHEETFSLTPIYTISYQNTSNTSVAPGEIKQTKFTRREEVVLPTITKDKYTFKGWYTTSNFEEGTEIYTILAGTTINQTVYAKFSETATYYYVSPTGKDTNSGQSINYSDSSALQTLGAAISKINEANDSSLDWYIYMKGTFVGPQVIEGNIAANSITIIGQSGLKSGVPQDVLTLNDDTSTNTGAVLTVNTLTPVKIRNLKITGGNNDGDGAGIIVSKGSTVYIESGTLITENTSTGNGAGIYVESSEYGMSDTKLYLTGGKIQNNTIGSSKKGSDVYIGNDYADVYMCGAPVIDEIYLADSYGTINLIGNIENNASVTITPDVYESAYYEYGNIQKKALLSNAEGYNIDIGKNYQYFHITPQVDQDDNETEWYIEEDGGLNKDSIVSFLGEGTGSMSDAIVTSASEISLDDDRFQIAKRDGYNFAGWYYKKQKSSGYTMVPFNFKEDANDEDNTHINTDMTLYATWQCITDNIHVDPLNGADYVYVDEENGDDYTFGDGSELYPLRSIETALNQIKKTNNPTKDYTITIQGLAKESNLAIDNSLPMNSLTLQGSTNTDGIKYTPQNDSDLISLLIVTTNKPVTLQNITISISGKQNAIEGIALNIGNTANVTLEDGTIFVPADSNTSMSPKGLIAVETGGNLVMNTGAIIKDYTIKRGAVYVHGGSFTMNGGTITNIFTDGSGGAVYIEDGQFIMNSGEITGNSTYSYKDTNDDYLHGAGVCVVSGTFKMTAGSIKNNIAYMYTNFSNLKTAGGGVFVYANGSFEMTGGEISGNKAINATSVDGDLIDTMYAYGGGICLEAAGNKVAAFTMTGGTISGNTAGTSGNGIGFLGTPNEGVTGTITLGGDAVIASNNDIYLPNFMTITIASELSGITEDNKVYITTPSHTEGTQVVEIEEDAGISLADACEYFTVRPLTGVAKLSSTGTLLEGHITLSELETVLSSLNANDASTPYKIVITDSVSDFATTNEILKSTFDTAKKYVTLSFLNASFTSMEGVLSEYITSLTIPASVTSVGFIDAGENFSSFVVASGNSTFTASSGILYANSGKTIVRYPPATTATTVNIASNITAISDGAFVGCKNIEAFTVSSGNSYFKAQPSMDWDNLATSYTGLVAYQELNFFKKDETLGSAPSDINSEEYTVWQRKANAQYNHYGYATIPVLTSYDETILIACPPAYASITQAALQAQFPGASNSSAYSVYTPTFKFDAVRPYAFGKCDNLTSVYLTINNTPESTEYTFYKCANMTGIDFNCSISKISPYTFTDCTSLSWVRFDSATTTVVEVNALAGCTALTQLWFQAGSNNATVKSGAYPSTCSNVQITGYVA